MNIKTIMNGMADSKHIKCAQNCITNNTDNLMTEDSIPVECILWKGLQNTALWTVEEMKKLQHNYKSQKIIKFIDKYRRNSTEHADIMSCNGISKIS